MTRPLSDIYKDLPPELSMDYRMTADTLWAVWFKTLEYSSKKVGYCFMLANPGEQGLHEIIEGDQDKEDLLCILSLPQLRELVEALNQLKPSFFSKLPSWLGGHERYVIVEEKEKGLFTTLTEASSEEECYAQMLSNNPEAKILWVAPIAPLIQVKDELEQILKDESYTCQKLYFDRRPVAPGHPKDWFEYMQRPDTYPAAKEAREYFAAHPGSWERAIKESLEDIKKGSGPILED